MVKVSYLAGAKLLIRVTLRVPAKFAAPVAMSWSYSLPGVVPPISILRVPVGLWVKLPVTVKMPGEAPGLIVPELANAPPTVRLTVPLFVNSEPAVFVMFPLI